jgi:hypothetical protein
MGWEWRATLGKLRGVSKWHHPEVRQQRASPLSGFVARIGMIGAARMFGKGTAAAFAHHQGAIGPGAAGPNSSPVE